MGMVEQVGMEDPLVETVLEGRSDTEADEGLTDSSSVGSLAAQDMDANLESLVDLSDGGQWCLVLMTRQAQGQRVLSCCGYPREICKRRGHRSKQG